MTEAEVLTWRLTRLHDCTPLKKTSMPGVQPEPQQIKIASIRRSTRGRLRPLDRLVLRSSCSK
jgi:hypothetical protein